MNNIWKMLLKLSSYAASRLYKGDVIQVDIHLADGRKLMVMDKDESEKLVHYVKELGKITPQQVDAIKKAISEIESATDKINGMGKRWANGKS
ncbi:hypothetical protein [Rahnella inusitata]|uniref:hypothetical protein n=1 Tax=Rahnella inusitata TaxID=58169 RepID=UPI0039BEB1A3